MSLPWESVSPEMENGLPHQCAPQGYLLRGEHWFAMTILYIKFRNRNNYS